MANPSILLSAYACEPSRGSEPGVGWEWATRLAARHNVTVITRFNNRAAIEKALADCREEERPKFVYVDLPAPFLALKRVGVLPVALYYVLWQSAARLSMAGRFSRFDLVHHVTFNGFRFPGAWWLCPIPVVLGPLGGGSIASPAFRPCFGRRWLFERLRNLSIRLWRLNPWTILSLLSSDAVLAVGDEMAERFRTLSVEPHLMLETAVPAALEMEPLPILADDRRDFLIVGNVEPWKGWSIAFEAYAHALHGGHTNHRLVVIGNGRQLEAAKRMARDLGIAASVDFTGSLPREALWERVRTARGLLFPSIRETSGNAALEAMALACPVVCFAHQGIGWITNEECAIRITPSTWQDAVSGFSTAITRLSDDPELAESLGRSGRRRAMEEFSWQRKIESAESIYRTLAGN